MDTSGEVAPTLQQAVEQNEKAKQIIQSWVNKRGHDRCWYYPDLFRQLADLFGIETQDPGLPPEEEFRAGCERYRKEEYAACDRQERLTSLAKPSGNQPAESVQPDSGN